MTFKHLRRITFTVVLFTVMGIQLSAQDFLALSPRKSLVNAVENSKEVLSREDFVAQAKYGSRTTYVSDKATMMLEEGFETWPPAGWGLFELGDTIGGWLQDGESHSGDYSLFHDEDNGSALCENWAVTPAITINNPTYALGFWEYCQYNGQFYQEHKVAVLDGPDPSTAVELAVLYSACGTSTWTQKVFSLSAFNGQTVYIGFYYEGQYNDKWNVDDVEIFELSTNDFSIVDATVPWTGCASTVNINFEAKNEGATVTTEIDARYSIDGGNVWTSWETFTFSSPLAFGSSEVLTFTEPADFTTPGSYGVIIEIESDEIAANNQWSNAIQIAKEISVFPYTENFEASNEYLSVASNSYASVGVETHDLGSKAMCFQGGTSSSGWSSSSGSVTPTNAWADNVTHQANAFTCNVNAPNTLNSLFLTFDLLQTNTYNKTDYSWFRVLVDDGVNPPVQLADLDGDTNFVAPVSIMDYYRTIRIDLSSYIGDEFQLIFQSACKYEIGKFSQYPKGDAAWLDNVYLGEIPNNDVSASFGSDEPFYYANGSQKPKATIINYGLTDQTTPFNVTLTIEPGNYSSTKSLTLGALSDTIIEFDTWSADQGTYSATVTSYLSGDEVPANDSEDIAIELSEWYYDGEDIEDGFYLSANAYYDNGTDRLLFSMGGSRDSWTYDTVAVYNYNTGTWGATTSLPQESVAGCAATYQDQLIVHLGDSDGSKSDSVFLFDIANEVWSPAAVLPAALSWTSMTVLNGNAYLAGGFSGAASVDSVFRYDFANNTWTSATKLPAAVYGGNIVATGSKLIYIQGVCENNLSGKVFVGEVDETNPDVITWTEGAACPRAVYKIQAVPLNDSEIVFTGGDYTPGGWKSKRETWIYNVDLNEWSQAIDKPTATTGYAAGIFLSDDKTTTTYVVASGVSNGNINYNVEALDFLNSPEVHLISPEEGASNVQIDATVSIEFNMPVSAGTGTVTIADGSGNTVSGVSATISSSNNRVLEIAHDAFDFEETYTVTVEENAVMNGEKGSAAKTWSFSTVAESMYTVTFIVNDGTDPLEGATVTVNGTDLTTNTSGEATIDLANGTYNYDVTMDGYDDEEGTVTVADAAVSETVSLTMTEYTVTFIVNDGADPLDGATITINGTDLTTNADGEATIDLVNGDYPYNVTLESFLPSSGTVTVSDNTVTEEISLDPDGILDIKALNINIYPNPSNGVFYVELDGKANIEILDMNGKAVYKGSIVNKAMVDVSNNPAGSYIMLVKKGENVFTTYIQLN